MTVSPEARERRQGECANDLRVTATKMKPKWREEEQRAMGSKSSRAAEGRCRGPARSTSPAEALTGIVRANVPWRRCLRNTKDFYERAKPAATDRLERCGHITEKKDKKVAMCDRGAHGPRVGVQLDHVLDQIPSHDNAATLWLSVWGRFDAALTAADARVRELPMAARWRPIGATHG